VRPRERTIENACVELAKTAGWVTLKLDRAARSWPDRMFLGPINMHFFVEFKRPGEEPRKQQLRRIEELKALGHHVYVLDSVEAFQEVFSHYHSPRPDS